MTVINSLDYSEFVAAHEAGALALTVETRALDDRPNPLISPDARYDLAAIPIADALDIAAMVIDRVLRGLDVLVSDDAQRLDVTAAVSRASWGDIEPAPVGGTLTPADVVALRMAIEIELQKARAAADMIEI